MNGLQNKKNDLIYDLLCLQLGHAGPCLRECKSFVLSLRLWKKKVLQLVGINWSVLPPQLFVIEAARVHFMSIYCSFRFTIRRFVVEVDLVANPFAQFTYSL